MQDDAFSFCALVTTASRMGNAHLLAEVLESAKAADACNVAVCNAAIEAFGKLDDAQVNCYNIGKLLGFGEYGFCECKSATVRGRPIWLL